MRPLCWFVLVLVGCGSEPAVDHGPAPGPDHREVVRQRVDELLAAKYPLEAPSDFRFADPVPGRVPRWHFEPQGDGQVHEFGYLCGHRVDFWVTPHYEGYPPQPESYRMAFFAGGALRAVFTKGGGSTPLGLDAWSELWIDESWTPPAKAQPAPR